MKTFTPILRRVVLEITTRCNATCRFCPNIHDPNRHKGKDWTSVDFVEKVFPHISAAKHVCFCCAAGEPYLNKALGTMMEFLKRANVRTSFFTNGESLKLSERLDKTLAFTDAIEWSLISFSPETQQYWMQGTKVNNIKEHMNYVCTHFPKLDLGVTILVLEDNIKQLPETVRALSELGCRRIHFSPIRESGLEILKGKTLPSFSADRLAELQEALAACIKIDPNIYIPPSLKPAKADIEKTHPGHSTEQMAAVTKVCNDPWTSMNIYHNGLTSACCIRSYPVGNIFEGTSPLWSNAIYEQYRSGLLSGELLNVCQTCDMRASGTIHELERLLMSSGLEKAPE